MARTIDGGHATSLTALREVLHALVMGKPHTARWKTLGFRVCSAMVLASCGDAGAGSGEGLGHLPTLDAGEDDGLDGLGDASAGTSDEEGDGGRLDVASVTDIPTGGGDGERGMCRPVNGDAADGVCGAEERAAPDSFSPEIQWSFTPPDGNVFSLVTPLVANLTDDNGDGVVDMCDTPDVVMTAMKTVASTPTLLSDDPSYIYVLDGATGALHFRIPDPIPKFHTPALGDVDGDGEADIVTVTTNGALTAWGGDGTKKWTRPAPAAGVPVSLADLDNDGDVEIILRDGVYDHEGQQVYAGSVAADGGAVAVDLDGDGDLEVVGSGRARHHDGSEYYARSDLRSGFIAVADLDDDPEPEILVTGTGDAFAFPDGRPGSGIAVLEHDGTLKYASQPRGRTAPEVNFTYSRPATIHDFDGDGAADYAVFSAGVYAAYRGDGSELWSAQVQDNSGYAAGTAFDFLGDGVAEAMYADEIGFLAFDGATGVEVMRTPRLSRTDMEYPTVADIDNDGSAEVLVVSNESLDFMQDGSPTLMAIRDADDRWVRTRRIWNQYNYFVTNVNEDGTIPQHQRPHWDWLNTFRTNVQIGVNGLCRPIPG